MSNIHFNKSVADILPALVAQLNPSKIIVLTGRNTYVKCYPCIQHLLPPHHPIVMECGEAQKSLGTLTHLLRMIEDKGANRRSLLINLGGGKITDLGGLTAALYHRGIKVINIPTSLLGMVDAAIGGKVAVNGGSHKNCFGTFYEPTDIIIDTEFLNTLPKVELVAGLGECYKYALLMKRNHRERTIGQILHYDKCNIESLIKRCTEFKRDLCKTDPHDEGARIYLNLGHTIGHGIEEVLMQNGTLVRHGQCVGWGLICTLILSVLHTDYPKEEYDRHVQNLLRLFGTFPGVDDFALMQAINGDKKNLDECLTFVLLDKKGRPVVRQLCHDDVREALRYAREERINPKK